MISKLLRGGVKMFFNFLIFKDSDISLKISKSSLILLSLVISCLTLFLTLILPSKSIAQCDLADTACLVNAAMTPPERAAAIAILSTPFNPDVSPPVGACPNVSNPDLTLTPAQEDFKARCTELVTNSTINANLGSVRDGLGEMSVDKLASEGSSFVETSNQNIGSRIAALRGSATAISLGVFSLNINGSSYNGTSRAIAFNYDEDKNANPNVYDIKNDKYLTINDANNPGTLLALATSDQSIDDQLTSQSRLGLFINGEFTFGDKDATSREAGFDFNIFGITGGADYMISENFFLGIALNYSHNDIDLDSDGGELDSNGYSASIYGTYYLDNFYFDGIVTLGWVDFDIDRNINYSILGADGNTVTINQTAIGDTHANMFSFSVGTGYQFNYEAFSFGPYGRLDFIRSDIDGYSEKIGLKGQGVCDPVANPGCGLALRFNSQDITSLTTALGGQASYAWSTSIGVIQPQALFGWIHEYENDSRTISAFFVEDPSPSSDSEIRLLTDNPDRNYFELGLGLSATFPHGISAFVYYETLLALRNVETHSFVVGFRGEI